MLRRSRSWWTTALAVAVLGATVAAPGGADPSDVTPFRTAEAFVRQQFVDFLGRTGGVSEVGSVTAQLTEGTATKAEVVDQVAHLAGGADVSCNVTRLYTAYFLRNPDISGLTYWIQKARDGRTLNSISSSFATSSEFKTKYGALSNAGFVDRAYQNVFGRPADPGGRSYWIKKLDGGTSRGVVMVGFAQSSEYRTKTAATCELVLAYGGLLKRIPTGTEAAGALDVLAAEGFEGLADDLLALPAYPARFPAPGAVTNLKGVGGDKQVRLSWSAAPANGGSLAGYVVRPFVGAVAQADRIVGPTTTSTVVTGLSNGTTYTFQVFAYNAQRNGPIATSAPVKAEVEVVWSTMQGNAAHTGVQPHGSIPAAPTQRWEVPLDSHILQVVVGSQRVFAMVEGSSATSGKGARVYALSPTTGAKLWGPVPIPGTYAEGYLGYDAGRVFLGNDDGLIKAVDATTGSSLWSRDLNGFVWEQEGLTVANGAIYTFAGDYLYAVDTATGAIRWKLGSTMNDEGTPAVDSTGIYVTQVCDHRYKITLSGSIAWSTAGACTGGGSGAVSLSGGKAWSYGVHDSYAIHHTSNGQLFDSFAATEAPALVGTRAVYNDAGTYTGVEIATGRVLWTQAGDGEIDGPPVVNGSRTFAMSNDGNLYAFDLATGSPSWTRNALADLEEPVGSWELGDQALAIGDGILLVPLGTTLVAYG